MKAFFKLGGSPVGIFHPARGQEKTDLCPGLLCVTALHDQHRSSAGELSFTFWSAQVVMMHANRVKWSESPIFGLKKS